MPHVPEVCRQQLPLPLLTFPHLPVASQLLFIRLVSVQHPFSPGNLAWLFPPPLMLSWVALPHRGIMDGEASAHTTFYGGQLACKVRSECPGPAPGWSRQLRLAGPVRHWWHLPSPLEGDLSKCEQIPERLLLKILLHVFDQTPLLGHR